ncbi:hypothetical protein GA0070622_0031 [Micromonospora sediminicola]|uniref:Uncharacterized protein n=1 Tax=Micromonospora sediminicola TaxID=946078 RepID=A0A1A9B0R3_9ACTN|nr:hypothetical protein [Micromonospora sediminicola]SBT63070.1 hypothetical protein GA0070622_0010 [Micromonospora sediminicola]SBT63091.1 hypothetical protein GA0070622_0031 [Micromonospora sediminicola]
MAALLVVKVHLDWTGPGHYDRDRSLPCRVCATATKMRDGRGDACHQSCAEDEIARELLGTGRTLIDDERIPTPARTLEVSS